METNKKTSRIVIGILAAVSVILVIVYAVGIGGGSKPAPAADETGTTTGDVYYDEETSGSDPAVSIPDDYNEADYIDDQGGENTASPSDAGADNA